MKLIHLISGGDVGGAKTHVLSLLQGLGKTEQAKLVCFTEGEFAEEAREMGIDTAVLAVNPYKAAGILAEQIRREEIQIVHCHGARANLVGFLLRKKISVPVVTTVHSDYRLDYLGRPLGRLTFGTINTLVLRFMDDYIGVSDSMAELLISRGFDPLRIFSIYNGVDFSPRTAKRSREEYLDSLGVPHDENTLVCGIAARLSAVKDVATLIRGFGLAAKREPNLRLIIAGDGEQRQELEALAKTCCPEKTCFFAGWVEDMDSFYNALDVNTLTSLSETFPYALTEGARMHCATIASRVGGVPRLIEDGRCGLLFEPKNAEELAEHILHFARDREFCRAMGQALYEKASREFSVEATVERQKEIYRTILRRRARKAERKRDGVMICGAYGRGNAGDDAILEAIACQMRSIDPDLPLYVLTRSPRQTAARYRVGTVHTFRYLRYCRLLRKTKLYLNGGGSLIQDVTSSRSLFYYLCSIASAKRHGNRVLMYGCGIGPVNRRGNRRLAGRVIDRCVDQITLRESASAEELQSMGVTKPEIRVTADPAMLLRPADAPLVAGYLRRNGLDPQTPMAFIALRPWRNMRSHLQPFLDTAVYLREQCGLEPVFLAMEPAADLPLCLEAARRVKGAVISAPENSAVLVGLLAQGKLVVSMRLHALIFASGVGTPLVGVSYDPKVTAFLQYLGKQSDLSLDTVTAETLKNAVDRELSAREDCAGVARRLRELAEENTLSARKLLEEAQ